MASSKSGQWKSVLEEKEAFYQTPWFFVSIISSIYRWSRSVRTGKLDLEGWGEFISKSSSTCYWGMTLPISPYCERVFSPQNLINCQKIRLLAERLDILMLIFPFGLALRKWKAGEKAVYLLTFVCLFDYSWKMKFSVVFLLMLASFCVTTAKAGVFFNGK